MKNILTILILFTVYSCNYFENKKVDPQDIVDEEMESINWSEVDEYPSFDFCDSIQGKLEKRDCFQNYLSQNVASYLSKRQLIVSGEIQDEAQMVITIRANGELEVDSVFIGDELKKELPEIDSLLRQSLDSLPHIYPAIKRGQQVKTRFSLPIRIEVE